MSPASHSVLVVEDVFMSASATDDLLDPDARFIAKPFALERIVDTVDDVLDR